MRSYQKRFLTDHRRSKRKAALRRYVLLAIGTLVFVLLLAAFLLSKYFWVDNVVIEGYARTSGEELRAHVDGWLSERTFFFPWHRSIWLLPADTLKADLAASFPTLKDITIDRTFPDSLHLALREYDSWGVLCQNEPEECFWIDRAGVAFEPAPQFSGLIVPKIRDERAGAVTLGSVRLSQELMRLITYFNERAPNDDKIQSLQFTISAKDQTVRATTRARWDILLFANTDPEAAYKNLRTALEGEIKDKTSELEYIDLRFGNRVFYKFRSE